MKDKQATTRQWLSVPGPRPRARARARGSRAVRCWRRRATGTSCASGTCAATASRSVLTGAATDDEVAALRARFADARRARRPQPLRRAALRRGRATTPRAAWRCCAASGSERDKRKRRLMLSALQSAVFNRALELRATAGALDRRPAGRRAARRLTTGGLFASTEPDVDQPRVDAASSSPPGPCPAAGRSSRRPARPPARSRTRRSPPSAPRARTSRAPGRELPGRAPPGPAHGFRSRRLPRRPALERGGRAPCACASRLPAGGYATVVVAARRRPHGDLC